MSLSKKLNAPPGFIVAIASMFAAIIVAFGAVIFSENAYVPDVSAPLQEFEEGVIPSGVPEPEEIPPSACGNLDAEETQNCCTAWAEENGIATVACVGSWSVEGEQCSWQCGFDPAFNPSGS